MERRPLPNESHRGVRLDRSSDQPALEVDLGLLALMLDVEVCRLMVFVEHSDHDSEEHGDDRHRREYTMRRSPVTTIREQRCHEQACGPSEPAPDGRRQPIGPDS